MIKILSLLIIGLVWLSYYLNFGLDGKLSGKTDVWGQFGDYVGGVVNPILSFITIYLLIQSLALQREANSTLVNEIQRQERLEKYNKFEVRFFSLLEAQDVNFTKFKISVSENVDDDNEDSSNSDVFMPKINILKAHEAVDYIDNSLAVLVRAQVERSDIIEWLNDLDLHDCFFSVSRRFYLMLKLINEKVDIDEREDQYEALLNLTDAKILILIVILIEYFEWDILVDIKKSGVLNRSGLVNYVDNYKDAP